MPNAILRAGPFATSTDSFLDEPDDANSTILPVNCAMNSWTSSDWKLYCSESGSNNTSPNYGFITESYISGPTVTKTATDEGGNPSGGHSAQVMFKFMTQAAVSFDIKITSNTSSSGSGDNFILIINGEEIVNTSSPLSEERTITVQASTTPRQFQAILSASANAAPSASGVVTATLKIQPA